MQQMVTLKSPGQQRKYHKYHWRTSAQVPLNMLNLLPIFREYPQE